MEASSPNSIASLASDLEALSTSSDSDVQNSEGLLNDDPFSNEISKRLFDAIDDLRKCGAGQDLDLPQLVIVGNQSAGKSSLLRSLTDIPFSVGGGLCTRFATRIISRRTPPGTSDLVVVSIEPGDVDPFGYENDDEPAPDFNYSVPTITAEAFEGIVKHASEYMGILSNDGLKKRNFSSKVLKIELSGPKRSHFGILDVPGVFSVPTDDITREELDGVDQMVASYMNQPQNIIICVAPANSDLAHQKIFNIASAHADSSRIVGVFTKCDVASRKEAEYVVKVIKEKREIQLESDWFVTQNPDFESPLSTNYKELERATFSKFPWTQLPLQQRGIASLKEFLAKLLCRQIRIAFPEMQKTIRGLLAEQEDKLLQLGPERPDDQRLQYLLHVVRDYNNLAQQALTSPENLPSPAMKLRGLTRTGTDRFSAEIKSRGQLHSFLDIGQATPEALLGDPLYTEIRQQIAENRGEELIGMMNPAIVKSLFKKQASRWETLGEIHLNGLISQTYNAAITILKYVCAKKGVSADSQMELEDFLLKFKSEAGSRTIQTLKRFCLDVSTNPLYTNNDSFIQKVKAAQQQRFGAALGRYRATNPPDPYIASLVQDPDPKMRQKVLQLIENEYANWVVVDLNNVGALFEEMHPSGVQNKEDEVHDLLKAYYEVARDEYIFYMTHHIIEPFLQDPKGLLFGLSQDFVMGLSEEEQDSLGAEDEIIIRSRKETEAKIQRLKEAKKIGDLVLRKTKIVDL